MNNFLGDLISPHFILKNFYLALNKKKMNTSQILILVLSILIVCSMVGYIIYISIGRKENMLMFFRKDPIEISSKKDKGSISPNNTCNLLIQRMKSIERKKTISEQDVIILQNIQKNLKLYNCSSPNAHI